LILMNLKNTEMFDNLNIADNIKNTLSKAVFDNKISHAYLFCGKDKNILDAAAQEFSKGILCKNKPEICENCHSCVKVLSGTHPDIIKIIPEGASISIKQIKKELIEKIKFFPHESDRKIYIIYNADTMQKPAQNSLLKTLEEAYGYAIIILLAKSKNPFYQTILSRCQIFDFGESEIPQHITDAVFDALSAAASNDYESVLQNSFILSNEEDISQVLASIASALRDFIVYNLGNNKDNIINKDKLSTIARVSKFYNTEKLKKTVDYICDIRVNASTNKNLIIKSIFLYLDI